jgi:hypothetical protein
VRVEIAVVTAPVGGHCGLAVGNGGEKSRLPATGLGATAVAAYAARDGVDVATFVEKSGPVLTLGTVGKVIVDLADDPGLDRDAYLLTAAGLRPVD